MRILSFISYLFVYFVLSSKNASGYHKNVRSLKQSPSLSRLAPLKVFNINTLNKDIWFQYAAITSIATASLKLEEKTKIGKALSSPVCSMLLSVLLTNLNILPAEGSIHLKNVVETSVKIATPLLLFNADLLKTYRESGILLKSFLCGTLGTMVGSFIGYILFGHSLVSLGQPGDGWKVASAIAAKNIGGGLNYMGVANGLGLSPQGISIGLTVDNIVGLFYFPFISYFANFAKDTVMDKKSIDTTISTISDNTVTTNDTTTYNNNNNNNSIVDNSNTNDTSTVIQYEQQPFIESLAVCFLITTVSNILSPILNIIPISLSTIITVVLATVFPKYFQRLVPSADIMGKLLLMLFLASIGSLSGTLSSLFSSASIGPLLGYNSVLYIIHLLLLFICGKIFKFSLKDLLIASSANIGNAATASSLAISKKWTSYIVPAVLIGCLGNAIGTFMGLFLGQFVFQKMF